MTGKEANKGAVPIAGVGSSEEGAVASAGDSAAAELAEAHTELFIGLVAPIGTDLESVTDELGRKLGRYGYEASTLRLSAFLSGLTWEASRDFEGKPYDERTWEAMDAGNKLREAWHHGDALALLSIAAIEAEREHSANKRGHDFVEAEGPPTIDRHAWLLRSLKTSEEVRTLRDVYGPRFFLVGAHCPEPARLERLRMLITKSRPGEAESAWKHAPSQLIDRDWNEELTGGQDVSGTFHQSDFFIDASDQQTTRRDVDRVLRILFGYPYATPTKDEYAMFEATGSELRSAELGRQVGAAIASRSGSVLSLGTNEVPAHGGGPYWEDDANDHREFTRRRDTNRERQEEIAQSIRLTIAEKFDRASEGKQVPDLREELLSQLAEQGVEEDIRRMIRDRFDCVAESKKLLGVRDELLAGLAEEILRTEVGDLTEFGRATHAEMSALMDAARRGVSVSGASLYTTTFPCHNCARHIVEAGIERVVFIEPYAKSKALDLHRDSIQLVEGSQAGEATKTHFEPFVGVAPRRYMELFDAGARERRGYPRRKNRSGHTVDFEAERRSATPVFSDLERDDLRPYRPVYRWRERHALDLLQDLFEESGIQPKEGV